MEEGLTYVEEQKIICRNAALKFAIEFSGNGFDRIESEELLRDAQKYYEFLTADLGE